MFSLRGPQDSHEAVTFDPYELADTGPTQHSYYLAANSHSVRIQSMAPNP